MHNIWKWEARKLSWSWGNLSNVRHDLKEIGMVATDSRWLLLWANFKWWTQKFTSVKLKAFSECITELRKWWPRSQYSVVKKKRLVCFSFVFFFLTMIHERWTYIRQVDRFLKTEGWKFSNSPLQRTLSIDWIIRSKMKSYGHWSRNITYCQIHCKIFANDTFSTELCIDFVGFGFCLAQLHHLFADCECVAIYPNWHCMCCAFLETFAVVLCHCSCTFRPPNNLSISFVHSLSLFSCNLTVFLFPPFLSLKFPFSEKFVSIFIWIHFRLFHTCA